MSFGVTKHNQTVLEELSPGDLIEFNRGFYSHWAVYKGGNEVIHLAGDANDGINANMNSGHVFTICGKRFSKACVKVDDFWEVTNGCKAYKNNKKDKDHSPRPADEILTEALQMIGEISYNVLWSNCEHFAKWCRYGCPSSQQAENFIKGAAWTIGAGLLAAGMAYMLGGSEEKGKKKQKA